MKNSNKQAFLPVRELAFLSLFTAAAVVGRTLLHPLPNVQPMTVIFLLIVLSLGFSRGMIVAILSLVITNLYMGMGLWTVMQIISYAVVLAVQAVLCLSRSYRQTKLLQLLYSISAGFLYGWVISWLSVQWYQLPHFWPYYIQGLSFDALHAFGNGAFYVLLAPVFSQLIQRFYPKKDKIS
ncbi:ECF transporter S component [Enterococcus sp. RIT-PI-f]|uniref:ECF transporter S component n=1 Tax=Enterococcus sp. RIT-PI-f TaxID=1690244 RepID=UPI0006B88AEB|nr:ECF transporter S component [Enterococcus sp. RIT-PI-f]KPG73289.1 metal ABC transporter permease [Enterococcus sp. RIT-PI-f]